VRRKVPAVALSRHVAVFAGAVDSGPARAAEGSIASPWIESTRTAGST
jgi:hypothetical protein